MTKTKNEHCRNVWFIAQFGLEVVFLQFFYL